MSITLYVEQQRPINICALAASTGDVLAEILALGHRLTIDVSYENPGLRGSPNDEFFGRESSPLTLGIRGEPEKTLVMPLAVSPSDALTIHYFSVNLWGPRTPLGYALMVAVAGAIGFDLNQEIEDSASFFTDHEALAPSEFVRTLKLDASTASLRDAAAAFLEKIRTRKV